MSRSSPRLFVIKVKDFHNDIYLQRLPSFMSFIQIAWDFKVYTTAIKLGLMTSIFFIYAMIAYMIVDNIEHGFVN